MVRVLILMCIVIIATIVAQPRSFVAKNDYPIVEKVVQDHDEQTLPQNDKESPTVPNPEVVEETSPVLIEKVAEQIPPTPTPPIVIQKTVPIEILNVAARSSLVNIICKSYGTTLRPISGTGIVIDSRGVILTNAHVAQYILLASQPEVDLDCSIRSGSPARTIGTADILYMPRAWAEEHAKDIRKARPLGTGEHDYAFLLLRPTVPTPPITFLPFDTREGVLSTGNPIFLAAYPAEFGSGYATQNDLNISSSFSDIKKLLTFDENTIDVISVGGVVLAQSGSSGGAAMDAQGSLVGVISTTSEGETTAERDLRAITLSYINRALISEKSLTIEELLSGDIVGKSQKFMSEDAPRLASPFISELTPQ